MVLNDNTIRKLIKENELITPSNEESIQPSSYDLHLDYNILIPKNKGTVKRSQKQDYEERSKTGYILPTGKMVLASTTEWVNMPDNIMGKVEGISSVGRLGLIIHAAGVIDPGFKGKITLELINGSGSPIDLSDFDRIGQIVFFEMKEDATTPYKGKYQNQEDVTGSRLYMEENQKIFHELVEEGTLKVCRKKDE